MRKAAVVLIQHQLAAIRAGDRGIKMRSMLHKSCVTWALLGAAVMARAQTVTLYDGAGGKTLDQGAGAWIYMQRPRQPAMVGKFQEGGTLLDTSADAALKAGYSYLVPFALDNTKEYAVRFTLKVISEAHGERTSRSGCSVIVLGSDGKGVELAFWTNEVWAQTDAFDHAIGTEAHAFDTTKQSALYTLRMAGGKYALSVNGAMLLQGDLHNYALHGPAIPYKLANYLFIGDDTTSAAARFHITRVDITPASVTRSKSGKAR